jgi:hypothetical protein
MMSLSTPCPQVARRRPDDRDLPIGPAWYHGIGDAVDTCQRIVGVNDLGCARAITVPVASGPENARSRRFRAVAQPTPPRGLPGR